MTLGELLGQSAEKYPDKPAIIYKDQPFTFKDLNAHANKLARFLKSLGVGPGDKVGILMINCPEFIVGVFGALKAGAATVSINIALQGRELIYVVDHSDARVVLTSAPYDDLMGMLRERLPKVRHILTFNDDPEEEGLVVLPSVLESYDDSDIHTPAKIHDLAAIYYTSGTTGLPKGAMLSHVNILSNCTAIIKAVRASRNDVALTCLPLFHALGMTASIMLPIFGGMTNVLLETFLPQPVLKGFSDWKVSFFVGVPTMYAVLANMPNLNRYNVSHFRVGFCGGAPLTIPIAEKFESRFSGKIYEGYGLSEASPVVSVNPLTQRKIGSIGKPLDERITWQIVDKHGNEVPRNAVGEIVVKGPNVMIGYYKDDQATKETIRDGWLHTGDLAYMDEDGFVFIADRKKDMIIVGGENVYPKEVEDVLVEHPAVQDAGVIGIEDPIRGEVPKAYIVPKLGVSVDEQDILAFCRKHLAAFKVPREIEVIESMPRNVTGKILKRILRRIAAGLPEEEEGFDEEEEWEEEVAEPAGQKAPTPPAGGLSMEEQIRMLEGGGAMAPPPAAAGMSFEEQIRMLEGGGPMAPPPEVAGLSIEEQMRLLEGSEEEEEEQKPPAPTPRREYPEGEAVGFDELLRQLVMEVPGGIEGSIVGFDGIGVASFTTDPDFLKTLADAELANIMGAVKKAAQSLVAGEPRESYFVTDRYGFVLKTIRDQFFVSLVLETKELNLGLTRLHMNKIVPLIEQELL